MTEELNQNDGGNAGDVGAEAGDIGAEAGNQGGGEGAEGGANDQAGKEESGATGAEPTELETLQTKLTELETKHTDLTSKMGRQSREVGLLRQIEQELRVNPEKALQTIAKAKGLDITFGAGKPQVDLEKQMSEGTAAEQANGINETVNKAVQDALRTHVLPHLQALGEVDNANKYADWDDMADTRQTLSHAVNVGQMTQEQLTHHAAQGFHLSEALTAAKEEGKAELRAELARKNEEQISTNRDGGGGGKDEYSFADFVKQQNAQ